MNTTTIIYGNIKKIVCVSYLLLQAEID